MSVKNVICPKLSSQWFLHSDHVLIQASFYCFVGGYDYIAERQWQSTPVLLPGKPHGRRSLEGCSPWGHWGSDTTKRLHFHFSLSCIGEGNGSPLQCSCLENPRDGGTWWAAVSGVAQSQTWLKWLSNSSSLSLESHSKFSMEEPQFRVLKLIFWNSIFRMVGVSTFLEWLDICR